MVSCCNACMPTWIVIFFIYISMIYMPKTLLDMFQMLYKTLIWRSDRVSPIGDPNTTEGTWELSNKLLTNQTCSVAWYTNRYKQHHIDSRVLGQFGSSNPAQFTTRIQCYHFFEMVVGRFWLSPRYSNSRLGFWIPRQSRSPLD